jgi:hypothetical protein
MDRNNFVSYDNISGSKNLPQEEKPFLSTSSNKYEEHDAYFNDGETTPPASQSAMGSMLVVLQHFDELDARIW